MKTIDGYRHDVGSHCETGSVRNLVRFSGLDVSEQMVFGIGSGPFFAYLFFQKGPSGLPLVAIRNQPGNIFKGFAKACGIEMFKKQFRTTDEAISEANRLIDSGVPVAVSVDMFYMKYLPPFLRVHAPFHFVLLVGRDGDRYGVSDPYFREIGVLKRKDLAGGWETHAPLARDNFLSYVKRIPGDIDFEKACLEAIRKTCRSMLLPPVIDKIVSFVGFEGMKRYARAIERWPDEYSGVVLREGILFNAVGFEDQGTGGGAFRLMYGAFLQEVAEMFGSGEMQELAGRMLAHGEAWREFSRTLIKAAKNIPLENDAFPDWYAKNEATLREALAESSRLFEERAEVERRILEDLRVASSRLS